MININKEAIAERFMKYVQIDTQSDPQSKNHPSTEKQKNLSILLVNELKQAGIKDAEMDQFGYVYATIPSNSKRKMFRLFVFAVMWIPHPIVAEQM